MRLASVQERNARSVRVEKLFRRATEAGQTGPICAHRSRQDWRYSDPPRPQSSGGLSSRRPRLPCHPLGPLSLRRLRTHGCGASSWEGGRGVSEQPPAPLVRRFHYGMRQGLADSRLRRTRQGSPGRLTCRSEYARGQENEKRGGVAGRQSSSGSTLPRATPISPRSKSRRWPSATAGRSRGGLSRSAPRSESRACKG